MSLQNNTADILESNSEWKFGLSVPS